VVVAWLALACTPAPVSSPTGDPRWVSLAPQVTETIGALGASGLLVGRSDWCTSPPEVRALPTLGSALTPNLEAIAALEPTLVLVEATQGTRQAELAAVAPTEALPWLTVADLLASTARLGELSGQREQAARWVETFRAQLRPEPPPTGPRVLLALAGEGLDRGEVWFLKRNSLHGAALHAAGARNAVDSDIEGAPVLSVEALLKLDPAVIIVLSPTPISEASRQRVLTEWSALAPLTAVSQRRVAVLGGAELLSTGPAIATLADRLGAALDELGAR
jgi:ABC-type Fe3+-hydroxamate transport system substrate-binding protein